MLNQNTPVSVTNISGAPVVYKIEELNLRREFSKGETKPNIPVKELRMLNYAPGGAELLNNYLSVGNDELIEELGIRAEPEYRWTEATVKDVLLNGPLEVVQDAIEFAPTGIKEMMKDLAVSLEINDISKRDAIFKATGFNVSKAIENNHLSVETDDEDEAEPKKHKTVAKTAESTGRRVTTDYKVVK